MICIFWYKQIPLNSENLKGFVQNRPPERVFRENIRHFSKIKNDIPDKKQA
jgi:hypothetical protein